MAPGRLLYRFRADAAAPSIPGCKGIHDVFDIYTIIREMTHKVLADLNLKDPLLDVAMALEEVALKDSYFVDRKLYPNVDFYSGIIYKALKIPTEMFTVMFAIARTAGWVAHWLEQQGAADGKIGRHGRC